MRILLQICLLVILIISGCGDSKDDSASDNGPRDDVFLTPCEELANKIMDCMKAACKDRLDCEACKCINNPKAEGCESNDTNETKCEGDTKAAAEEALKDFKCDTYDAAIKTACTTDPCDGKKAGDACTGGYCVEKVGGGLECAKECITVGIDNYSCKTDEGCYQISSHNVCLKGGDRYPGEPCVFVNDCVAGAVCLQPEGGSMACFKVCSKN